jgi:hypothetical protein
MVWTVQFRGWATTRATYGAISSIVKPSEGFVFLIHVVRARRIVESRGSRGVGFDGSREVSVEGIWAVGASFSVNEIFSRRVSSFRSRVWGAEEEGEGEEEEGCLSRPWARTTS